MGQPVVGPIDWGAHDGNLVEQTISVMLLKDHDRGWRRQASSGDAGVDVAIPIVGNGFEVSQIKSYTGPLTSKRKKEIERSLKSVIEGPELPGPVMAWKLVLPMNPSKEAEHWFRELTENAPFDCTWRGLDFINGLAAGHPEVVDYFFRDGKGRLEAQTRNLLRVADLFDPSSNLKPAEVTDKLVALHDALNALDPFYRYEFEVGRDRGWGGAAARPGLVLEMTAGIRSDVAVTTRVFARYPQATEDRPIKGGFTIDLTQDPDLRRKVDETFRFGSDVEIPYEAVRDLWVDAPGGLAVSGVPAHIRIIHPPRGPIEPNRLRFQLIDPEGTLLSQRLVDVVDRRVMPGGGIFVLKEVDGAFQMSIWIAWADREVTGVEIRDIEIKHAGLSPSRVLPGTRLLHGLLAPNNLVLAFEHGTAEIMTVRMTNEESFVSSRYLRVLTALDRIQVHVNLPITLPQEIAPKEASRAIEFAALASGGISHGTWNRFTVSIPAPGLADFVDHVSQGSAWLQLPMEFEFGNQLLEFGPVELKLLSAEIENRDAALMNASQSPEELVEVVLLPLCSNEYEAFCVGNQRRDTATH